MEGNEPRILVVDDEPGVLGLLRMSLQHYGLSVLQASSGAEAIRCLGSDSPDLVLLDVVLPDIDGFEVLRRIRQVSLVPVIMITVRADEADKIQGLELGADDYVTKPFSPAEVSARIKAVLRRTGARQAPRRDVAVVDERLQIDWAEQEVIVNGQRTRLRPIEARLLQHLIENAGRTVSFDSILQTVWGPEYRDETHYVHLYITYLRRKIEEDPAHPRYILTRRGLGYGFQDLPFPRGPAAESSA